MSPAPEASPTAQVRPRRAQGHPTPAATDSASPAATPSPSPSASASGSNSSAPDPTSLEWVTPELQTLFAALNCADPGAVDSLIDDPAKPLVTCDQTGAVKYILGPVVVPGSEIQDAAAGYQALPSGQMSNIVEIQLTLKSTGAKEYADISRKMVNLSEPQNQLAATLDSKVIVAPRFNEAILDGRASITGGFTIETARDLAQQLKFGALPISFDLQTREEISPTLGSEQLRYGLLAGLAGLVLVFIYSLAQYRVLGLVTVASIVFAGLLTYLAITILGWSHNYRLDMAGVTGLIIAIGFTADSFIVYFERIRDELRSGRSWSAVATGGTAPRDDLADGVTSSPPSSSTSGSSGVRGFAFTLGLTTLIDLLVCSLIRSWPSWRRKFRDGRGRPGSDEAGRQKRTSYAGRGRFVPNPGRTVTTSDGSAS